MNHAKVRRHVDPLTGLNFEWRCRHGNCSFEVHHTTSKACEADAVEHELYHASRWAVAA